MGGIPRRPPTARDSASPVPASPITPAVGWRPGPSPPARQRVLGTARYWSRCRAGSLSAICPHHKGTTPLFGRGLPTGPQNVTYAPSGCTHPATHAGCPPGRFSTRAQLSAAPTTGAARLDLGVVTRPDRPVRQVVSGRLPSHAAPPRTHPRTAHSFTPWAARPWDTPDRNDGPSLRATGRPRADGAAPARTAEGRQREAAGSSVAGRQLERRDDV